MLFSWPLLLSCAQDPVYVPPVEDTDVAPQDTGMAIQVDPAAMTGPALVRRLSFDLRGVVPTLEELQSVEAEAGIDDPAMVSLVNDFLADDRFEERMVDLYAEKWLTRLDLFNLTHDAYELPFEDEYVFESSVGEEPLRVAAHVLATDAPYSEIVTGDYTMANSLLAEIWDLDYPDEGQGWEVAYYTDGRPSIGVLATNGLWWTYDTSPSNVNRRRAAALSRLLLCDDFLTRPISFSSASLLSEDGLQDAIRTDPACLSCHSTVDPIASALFGFWWFDRYDTTELTQYHPEREELGAYFLDVEPAWFGEPIDGIDALGQSISNDPRFTDCAVETIVEMFWRREVELVDFNRLQQIEAAWHAGSGGSQDLVWAVLKSDLYLAGHLTTDANEGLAAAGADALKQYPTRRILSDSQLADVIEDLTGFRWESEGFDQFGNDTIGFRVIAGGVDGDTVTQVLTDPSLPRSVVMKRLTQAAASTVVANDLAQGTDEGDGRRLLKSVQKEDLPGEDAFVSELEDLHLRLYATSAEQAQIDGLEALWETVEEQDGPEAAWGSVVSVMLRDPAFWVY